MAQQNNIKDAALYWATYARMRDTLRHVSIWKPAKTTRLFRAVRPKSGTQVTTGRAGADKYRTVYESTTNDYRWTGPRPPTPPSLSPELRRLLARPAVGGLNLAVGLNDATLGEFVWYATAGSKQTTFDDDARRRAAGQTTTLTTTTFTAALAVSRVFEYALPAGLPIADLSLGTSGGQAILDALITDIAGALGQPSAAEKTRVDALLAGFKRNGYVSPKNAYTASGDYSFCRALSQAVRDFMPGCRGVRVTSVRADAGAVFGEFSGDNVILFGDDGAMIRDLRPVHEFMFIRQHGAPMQTVKTPL